MVTILAKPDMADLATWAARELGVALEAPVPLARDVFLRTLADVGFVPSEKAQEALAILTHPRGLEVAPPDHVLADLEQRLGSEVEAFATAYFAIPPDERRRRWHELRSRCGFSTPLAARLQSLEAGLDLLAAEFTDRDFHCTWLARYVCDLYVLKPPDRAVQRQDLTQTLSNEGLLWQKAACRLRRRYPSFAALEPVLVARLAAWGTRQKSRAWMQRRQARAAAAAARALVPTTRRHGPSFGWLGWVGMWVAIGVSRMAFSPPPRPAPPQINVPTSNWTKEYKLYSDPVTGKPVLPPGFSRKPTAPEEGPDEQAREAVFEILQGHTRLPLTELERRGVDKGIREMLERRSRHARPPLSPGQPARAPATGDANPAAGGKSPP
jgi:hypothetical protein